MTLHEQIRDLAGRALQRDDLKLVDSIVRKNRGTVIDVGTNTGGFVGRWLEHGADAVHCFEPVPWVFEELHDNWQGDMRVVLNCLGLSDRTATYRDMRILNAHTLAKPAITALDVAKEDRGPFDFDTTTLDFYVDSARIDDLGFVKIDVDGFEPAVLRGATRVMLKQVPMMMELSFLPYKLNESIDRMIEGIYGMGYKVVTMAGEVCMDEIVVLEAFPWRTSFDVLLIHGTQIDPQWPKIR